MSVLENVLVSIGYYFKIPWLQPNVVDVEGTFQKIIRDKVSVSRYGDGELKRAIGRRHDAYKEVPDANMRRRLREILKSNEPNHIVCIQNVFEPKKIVARTNGYRKFWMKHLGVYRMAWYALLKRKKQYYSTEISRCYLSYTDKSLSVRDFAYWKQVWDKRNVLMVEGDKTGVGVGNDLLDNAVSVRRIIVPAENAYGAYDRIVESVKKYYQPDDLILIAAGATATILAYDLALLGMQAIDLGHVDVEYEWFLRKAPGRMNIPGKYVNETKAFGGIDVPPISGEKYEGQIVEKIMG